MGTARATALGGNEGSAPSEARLILRGVGMTNVVTRPAELL